MQPRINVALKAARAAVDFILHVQEKILFDKEQGQNPEQAYKDICIGAEKTIVHTLAKAYPTETITTRLQGEVQTGEKGEWIIDVSRNLSGHALTISYVENGKVEHALLINSSTRDEFYASKGRGAYLNNSRIRTSSIGSIENSTLGSQFPGTDKLSSQITSQFNTLKEVAEKGARVMMQDCPALMLANVAAGKLDAVWAMKLYDWETQAPLFIAKEAGCLFSDFQGSPSVNDTVLCANPRLFKSLLPVLNKHF